MTDPGGTTSGRPSPPGGAGSSEPPQKVLSVEGGHPTAQPDRPNAVVQRTREFLDRGEYATAVLYAYRTAFEDTVRAYALEVPVACTDRRFLQQYLRPDMGKLVTLLPELFRRYEPVRFGTSGQGDGPGLLALVERIYSETSLGTIYRPHYQPTGPRVESSTVPWPFYPSTREGGPP